MLPLRIWRAFILLPLVLIQYVSFIFTDVLNITLTPLKLCFFYTSILNDQVHSTYSCSTAFYLNDFFCPFETDMDLW